MLGRNVYLFHSSLPKIMEISLVIQTLTALFQMLVAILAVTVAFYIYLLQTYKGKFFCYHGDEKCMHFENPSSCFWGFFGTILFTLLSFIYLMFSVASGFFVENLREVTIMACLIAGIDLVYFGVTMKDFLTYPSKLRRFLSKYVVITSDNETFLMVEKKLNQ